MVLTKKSREVIVRLLIGAGVLIVLVMVGSSFSEDGQRKRSEKRRSTTTTSVSFKTDVFPIIQRSCLPCHSEDNYNPSELSLDDYDKMMLGGKNGPIWSPKNSHESLIMKKLSDNPPFGDRMPLNSKRKIAAGKAKWLTEEEIGTIAAWIDDGAKNN